MWNLLMARRALTIAMIVLAAGTSHAIAQGRQLTCQLSGMAIGQGSPNQRIYKTLLFNLDDSSGQLISGINGVLATTLGFSDREIVVRLRDIALTADAAPSLFGNQLYSLDASQSNFFLDRVTGNAVLSATYLSHGVVFAVGPCGQFAPQSQPVRGRFGAERD
jgi:hypothetical protein